MNRRTSRAALTARHLGEQYPRHRGAGRAAVLPPPGASGAWVALPARPEVPALMTVPDEGDKLPSPENDHPRTIPDPDVREPAAAGDRFGPFRRGAAATAADAS